MSSPAPVLSAPSLPLRVLRGIVVALLSLVTSFLLALAIAAWLPLARASITPLFSDHTAVSLVATGLIVVTLLLVPLLVFTRGIRRGWLTWPLLAGFSALAVAACIYLAWDDHSIRRPLSVDEIAPARAGDEASFTVLMRYGKNTDLAKAFKAPPSPMISVAPKDGEKWKQHLLAHRAEIEAGWAQLAPIRAWWDELARFDHLGDLTEPRWDAQIMAFSPVRSYSQFAVSIAALQALDGQGDAAFATLQTLYDVSRKLEPGARTLVRVMIAKVMQRLAIDTARFVLDHATVSPGVRAAFAATLGQALTGPAGARRLILIEYALFVPPLLSMPMSAIVTEVSETNAGVARVFGSLGLLLFNRRATFNLLGDRYYALAKLAEERRLGQLEAGKAQANGEFLETYHIKNLAGRLLADQAMPAFTKVVKTYWEIEDARLALIAQLKA